jgi:hypothetical protein
MNRHTAFVGLLVATLAIAVSSTAHAASPVADARTASSARAVVVRFFEAVESHRFREACSLLGARLLAETRGPQCPDLIRLGTPDPPRWKVLGTRVRRAGVGVLLRLGQNELDHVRMRTWLAIVAPERGQLRIVETRLLS